MFVNNLKIAIRNLLKHKYITMINLLGLVVGMTSALLIWQYVAFEKSYEDFQENADRIHRVVTNRYVDGNLTMEFAAGAAGAGQVLKENFAEIEDYVKMRGVGDVAVTIGTESIRQDKVYFASTSFFKVFSFELLKGDKNTCLKEPMTACISERTAKKHFGSKDPMGQFFSTDGEQEFKVTGIYKDMPSSSHMNSHMLLSYSTFSEVLAPDNETETDPFWDGFYTYFLLKEGVDVAALETKFKALIDKQYGEDLGEINADMSYVLQPLKSIHLNSNILFEMEPNGDANAVWFLMLIGSLVLIIAWFNYINLSTARAETRAKEVGVRKVIGSKRSDLISLFLTESSLINICAIFLSLGLAQILMPFFEILAGKEIPLNVFSSPMVGLVILLVFLLGTLLAGLYPAFVLSSFKPISVLKSNTNPGKGRGVLLRKGLVIAQFVSSITLVVGTIVVFYQIRHLQSEKLGVNIDQTLVLKAPTIVDSTYWGKFETFKQELVKQSEINWVSTSGNVPGSHVRWTAGGIRKWGADERTSKNVQAIGVDFDYLDTYEIALVAGKKMNKELHTDSTACLLNETAVKLLGLGTSEEVVGMHINFWGDRLEIVGVVEDFHQESPKVDFCPLILRVNSPNGVPGFISVKFKPEDFPKTLSTIKSKWSLVFGQNPFEYFFLDEHFAKQYADDQRFGNVFALFSLLAIFVSCLGLFALAAFMAEKRRKEIGIRKVLGASMENLLGLLFKDFLILLVVSILIAAPLSWWGMNRWLSDFASRIDMQWWFIAVAGLGAMFIALLTVSAQSFRVARANPIKALKEE